MVAWLVPSVLFLSLFTFLSITVWLGSRTKEREAFYRSELQRKILEQQGAGPEGLIRMLREEERIAQKKGRAGVILGGIITLAVGVGLFIMGPLIEEAVYAGSVPVTVGIGMLIYAFFFAPKPAPPGSDNLK